MDAKRSLYLVAYDISEPQRLQRICRYLTGYKVGGQKSVYEIWVTPAELRAIRAELEALMAPDEDRVHILSLDPRQEPRCYGTARSFRQSWFTIL